MGMTTTKPKLQLHLGDPGLTMLHRAGLAGLWMTLEQLNTEGCSPPQGLSWELSPRAIAMHWEGNDIGPLDWLLTQAFQIQDGLIKFSGLGYLDFQTRVTLHQGIRGTFLQHPSIYKAEGITTKPISIDELEIILRYQVLHSYVHQSFASNLCDHRGNLLQEPISVAGWLNPGAVVRHTAFPNQTAFEEWPPHALALLFAPVACQYFVLRSQLRDKRAQYALVIPEVTDLELYAKRHRKYLGSFGYKDFHASGLGDAGLSFLTNEAAAEITYRTKTPRCTVLTLGTVAWSSQQKTRTDIAVIEVNSEVTINYRRARDHLIDRVVQGKDSGFVATSFARELIAENLVRGQPWYQGISDKVNSSDLFKKLTYEREGLNKMVQDVQWDNQAEKLFVETCHEALRRTYGKLAKRAKDKGEIAQFDRENERIRTGLNRCKNAEAFREFITDFWSRAGQISTLQMSWLQLLPLINGNRNWKVGKDLTLLALASYKGVGKQEEDESQTVTRDEE